MQISKFIIPILFVLAGNLTLAQSTRVRGKVTDAETGEVLPFVNVFFKGTTVGMTLSLIHISEPTRQYS